MIFFFNLLGNTDFLLNIFLNFNSYLNSNGNDVEFEINSKIVTVEMGKDGQRFSPNQGAFHMDLDFEHTVMDYDTEKWNISCGVTYVAASDHAWDLASCVTRTFSSNLTRCSCNKPGTYAALLTRKSPQVRKTMCNI